MESSLASDIRSFVTTKYAERLISQGITPESAPDSLDLLAEGVIDSMGILEIIADIEDHFNITVDLEHLPPSDLTLIGPLSRHIAETARRQP